MYKLDKKIYFQIYPSWMKVYMVQKINMQLKIYRHYKNINLGKGGVNYQQLSSSQGKCTFVEIKM
jgi:hypothetical protein